MPLRFTLVTAARCGPLLDERFDDGRPLDSVGLHEAGQAAERLYDLGLPGAPQRYCSPSPRARQTGAVLGIAPLAQPALRDCDMGRWAGGRLDQVMAREPEAVDSWLADPRRAPYGGEPLTTFIARVGHWMDTRTGDEPGGPVAGDRGPGIVAVVDPGVARAAVVYSLGVPPQVFWRLDPQPMSLLRIAGERGSWTVRFQP
ncbi:histidine phosphatase family protein [Phaeacidiphilus oryzae]|uniref:histidine phosphatase family protein n=1 Tax=Phaeacidiphilus oryzae TaxID=348818 RepID=UPI00055C6359|nr:histidine phosphatase family protein [Phaeacidiphilus oryzae]